MSTGFEKVYLGSSGAGKESSWLLAESATSGGGTLNLNGWGSSYDINGENLYVTGQKPSTSLMTLSKITKDGVLTTDGMTNTVYGESWGSFGYAASFSEGGNGVHLMNGQSFCLHRTFGRTTDNNGGNFVTSFSGGGNGRAVAAGGSNHYTCTSYQDLGYYKSTVRFLRIHSGTFSSSGGFNKVRTSRVFNNFGGVPAGEMSFDYHIVRSPGSTNLWVNAVNQYVNYRLMKLDSTHTKLWAIQYSVSSGNNRPDGIIADNSDNLYIKQNVSSTQKRVTKLDTNGTVLWSRVVSHGGGGHADYYSAYAHTMMAVTPDQTKVIILYPQTKLVMCVNASDGTVNWCRQIQANSADFNSSACSVRASNKSVYVTVSQNSVYRGLIAKLDIIDPKVGNYSLAGHTVNILSITHSSSSDLSHGISDFPAASVVLVAEPGQGTFDLTGNTWSTPYTTSYVKSNI